MSKRPFDTNQNKMSKTDRFVQMSQQEMLIEQKKREIQAKLEAKRRQNLLEAKEKEAKTVTEQVVVVSPSIPGKNQFSNDGSFLNQFKQLKEKKKDTKFKTFNKYKEREKEKEKEKGHDKEKEKEDSSEEKSQNKEKKSSTPRKRSPSPVDHHRKQSRYSADRVPSFEPQKITFNTSFSNASNFSTGSNPEPPLPEPAIEQPDDAEMGPLPSTTQTTSAASESVPAAATVDVAPPQTTFATDIINFSSQSQIITIASPIDQNLVSAPQLITTTVTQPLAPPPGIPPIIQQSVSIIDTTGQDLATSTQDLGQLGAPNLSSTAPSLQQSEPMITQTISGPSQIFATTGAEQIISGSPQMLMSVPPPQIMQQTQLILTPQTQSVLVSTPTSILTTVTLPPPVISAQNINVNPQNNLNLRSTGLTTVELTSIPPPNPIQVQNIPQPEPLNTLNIPPPAPLQVQNIPTPSSLQLNEIPNPKPLDLMAIPTPNEEDDVRDSDFIKNIPPPNRSVPPPNISEVTSVPPPNFLSNPPPRIHHNGPPSGQMQVSGPSMSQAPPPQPSSSRIPSLMSQPVLPPPGMSVNVPPPLLPPPPTRDVSQPPPNFLSQAPPPLPNLTVPPPMIGGVGGLPPPRGGFKDQIAGGAEFEAMANLARMVAECGPSVEDVVRQKKNRDPDMWFLFHKESSAYRQYANLVEQYKKEKEEAEKMAKSESNHDASEDYDPEMALEDYDDGDEFKQDFDQGEDFKQDYDDSRDDFKQDYDSGDQFKRDYDSRDRFKQDYDSRDQFKQDYDSRDQFKHDYDGRNQFKQDYDGRDKFKKDYDSRDRFQQDYDSKDKFKKDYDSRDRFKQDYDSRDKFKKDYDSSDQFKQDYDSRDRFKQDYDSREEFKQDYDDRMEFKQDFANRAEFKQDYDQREEFKQDYDQREEFKQEFKQGVKQEQEFSPSSSFSESAESASARRERKRKSRWGEKDPNVKPPVAIPVVIPTIGAAIPPVPGSSSMLSKVTRSDPGLIQYAMQTYGSANLSEEDWKKTEDNYKIHLLYQDMMRRKEELKKLQMQGRNKYEYDSDEDTEGGTWEHKLRIKEMQATERWACELTRQAEGKHHIGDFLPPEELDRFLEKSNAVKEGRQPNFSDYKEFKIKEDNIGFQMLQKLGWTEGQGLGQQGSGIVEPINKGAPRENTQGLGLNLGEATEGEDEYESYRKRMMLAYRFRPNPLNNPRRPYY